MVEARGGPRGGATPGGSPAYVCEVKFTNAEYVLTSAYRKKLLRKAEVFKAESKTGSAVQIVMVCTAGFRRTPNADIVTHVI